MEPPSESEYVVGRAFHGCFEEPPVREVIISPLKGRGLVASRRIRRGEIVFTEAPMAGTARCPPGVRACIFCMQTLCRVQDISSLAALPQPELWPEFTAASQCGECGTWFCSELCKRHAEDLFHRRLCAAQQPTEAALLHEALLNLDEHAQDVMSLALRMMAMMLQQWESNGNDTSAVMMTFLRLTACAPLADVHEFDLSALYATCCTALHMTEAEKGWLTGEVFEEVCNKAALNAIHVRSKSPFTE